MGLAEKIAKLKRERNAVILVHNYQIPEVQDIADFIGDSLGLSMQAAKTDADVIVFCGVYFMAETAKILSPDKTVLIPDKSAGCPMADMINAGQLRALKSEHPGAKVLCYVNTTAEVKAECDLCCTSANAAKMAGEVMRDEKEIIFVPDKYLAAFVTRRTGREFITWEGILPDARRASAGASPGTKAASSGGANHRSSGMSPGGNRCRRPGSFHGGDVPVCPGVENQRIHHRHRDRYSAPPEERESRKDILPGFR